MPKYHGGRIQDIVSRAAGVNLSTTAKVLRALELVLFAEPSNRKVGSEISAILVQSSLDNEGRARALHSKPSQADVYACNSMWDDLLKKYGRERVRAISNLTHCPFEDRNKEKV